MNRQDAAKILTVLAAPYGGEGFDEFAAEAWYHSALHAVPFEDGMEIAKRLIAHEKFRPTPAVFNAELRTARQHKAIAAAGVPALEAPRASSHPATEIIEELRKTLTEAGNRDHWHAGPKPCPVCGGLQIPRKKATRK